MFELLTPDEMAEADRMTIAGGVPGVDLMERAGLAVAHAAAGYLGGAPRVVVLAGPGNNGGDGFVAARILEARGLPVRVLLLGDRGALRGDAALAAARWNGPVEPASAAGIAEADILIDALFGAGLSRDISGSAAELIRTVNASDAYVVSVDLPSGIDGATGRVRGAAIRADESVTFFRRKPGHVLYPGRAYCGRVTVHDIGIPERVIEAIQPAAAVNTIDLWGSRFPIPQTEGHKYTRGHAVIVSGSLPMTGAARLAARGALRAGAGLVTLATPRDAVAVNAAANLAIMVRQVDDPVALSGVLSNSRIKALVVGPGGGTGPAMRDMVLAALKAGCGIVLDADALTSFEGHADELFSSIKSNGREVVLTPHLGEFFKLFSIAPETIDQEGKIECARRASVRSGAVVVLKGPDTVVASPDGRIAVAVNAPPWLATAGSGDVLAGIAGGLLGQGMPGFEAACAAVWLHGEAGQEVGPGLIAEDLPEALPAVYRRLFVDLGAWP